MANLLQAGSPHTNADFYLVAIYVFMGWEKIGVRRRSSLDSIHQTDILLSQDISLFLYESSWWNVHKSQSVFNF